jgi:hypothetical protein
MSQQLLLQRCRPQLFKTLHTFLHLNMAVIACCTLSMVRTLKPPGPCMAKTASNVVPTRPGAAATKTKGKPSPASGLRQRENASSAVDMICEHFKTSLSAPHPQERLCCKMQDSHGPGWSLANEHECCMHDNNLPQLVLPRAVRKEAGEGQGPS